MYFIRVSFIDTYYLHFSKMVILAKLRSACALVGIRAVLHKISLKQLSSVSGIDFQMLVD